MVREKALSLDERESVKGILCHGGVRSIGQVTQETGQELGAVQNPAAP